jgi:argininosuccinate lyase
MSRLWDKGAPLDERVLRYTAGEDHVLDERLVAADVRASIAHAEMLQAQGLLNRADATAIHDGLVALGAANGASGSRMRTARPRSRSASPHASATLAGVSTSAARAMTRCSPRCACTCGTR